MSDIDELIARIESASEGSRELDARIHIAVVNPDVLLDPGSVGPTKRDAVWGKFPADKIDGWEDYGGLAVHVGAPHYSISLDAALTLVPKGWIAEIEWRDAFDKSSSCVLHEFPQPCRRIPDKAPFVIMARSAPLSICIAALKARKAAAT